MQIIN